MEHFTLSFAVTRLPASAISQSGGEFHYHQLVYNSS